MGHISVEVSVMKMTQLHLYKQLLQQIYDFNIESWF